MIEAKQRNSVVCSKSPDARAARIGLSTLMGAVGRSTFEFELTRCLTEIFNCEFVHICDLPTRRPETVTSLAFDGSLRGEEQRDFYMRKQMWRFDPCMAAGSEWSSNDALLCQLDTENAETKELQQFYGHQDICERVIVFGKGAEGRLGLSIVRSQGRGRFGGEDQTHLNLLGEVIFPLLLRHHDLLYESKNLPRALSSLETIEKILSFASQNIPRREAQVVARMLYGVTTEGVASELSIGGETVISYRKRFYHRFELSGFRDLLLWYLALYGEFAYRLSDPPSH